MSAFFDRETKASTPATCLCVSDLPMSRRNNFGPLSQPLSLSCHPSQIGFTLLELLVVIAIIAILFVLVLPAFTSLKKSDDITGAAFTMTGVLEQARQYAVANNTYTYLGFYEESPAAQLPTHATPPYPGKGRVVLATVASIDGTTSCEDPNSTAGNPIPLIANKIKQVGRLMKVEGIHLTDVGPPASSVSPSPDPNSLDGRPAIPYTYASPSFDYQNRINSDDMHSPENHTRFPFLAQGYTFYKTVRFNSRGEANINATYELRRAAEIGLKPTHGSVIDRTSPNVVAIQFSGVGGNFKIYRR